MPLNINKYMKKKKRTCLDKIRLRYRLHQRKFKKLEYKQPNIMKDFCKLVFVLIICFILFLWGVHICNIYEHNIKYSIAMPTIIGDFYVNENYIKIEGLENIINDNIATLSISTFFCYLKSNRCEENRVSITGLGRQIGIFPYYNEYKIDYKGNNKIIFSNYEKTINGEIDLIAKTITFTTISIYGKPRKVEIITDNEKIQKLEKKIIRKYLKY